MKQATYHSGPRNFGTGFDMVQKIEALEADNAMLMNTLADARLQLQYLNERNPTGTTPAIIAQIDAALSTAPVGE
jgi:hypothetical protein